MAKGSGGAGRGRGGNDGRGGKDKDGWTTSVWDVKPGEKTTKVKRQMIDKAVRPQVNTNSRGLTKTIRGLQNQLRDLAKSRGYGDDDPIPGTGGLTMRKLRRNAASRAAQEGELRAAISQLLRGRPTRPASRPSGPARPASGGRPARPATGPIEIPRF